MMKVIKSAFVLIVLLQLLHAQNLSLNRHYCDYSETVNITDGVRLSNGDIRYNGIVFTNASYTVYNYEIVKNNRMRPAEPHLRGCLCKVKHCVRLCCPSGELVDESRKGCRPAVSGKDVMELLVPTLTNVTISLYNADIGFLYGKPCTSTYYLSPDQNEEDEWHFNEEDGTFFYDSENATLRHNDYCISDIIQNNENRSSTRLFLCFPDEETVQWDIYPVGMLLSVPFLLITFFVYALIPELRNLHGKSLMCYVLGLAVGYSTLSFVQLMGERYQVPKAICSALGFVIYFSFMVSFFWLNVMCFDLWWTFRGVRDSKKVAERKKYLLYSIYAWGCPILMLSAALFIEFSPLVPDFLKPRMGEERCWLINNKKTEFFYLYLPVIILVGINVVFFAITTLRILHLQRETAVVRKGDSKRHSKIDADRDRFSLYFRLLIVMGVTWTMEILTWAIGPLHTVIYYLPDICNTIQGFLIFMLFVWKPKVKALIVKRYRSIRGRPPLKPQHTSQSSRTCSTQISNHISTTEKTIMIEEKD